MRFSSLADMCRDRLTRLRKRKARKQRAVASPSLERLEDRALLSAVSFDINTGNVEFLGDVDDQNLVSISSPNDDTLIIQSRQTNGGGAVGDPIMLVGDAAADSRFVLSTTSVANDTLTIDVTGAGALIQNLFVNVGDEDDSVLIESTPADVATQVSLGSGDDTLEIGSAFDLDDIRGEVAGNGGSGVDQFNVLDFLGTSSDSIIFRADSITGIAPVVIDYDAFEDVRVDVTDNHSVEMAILSTDPDAMTRIDLTFNDLSATVTVGALTGGGNGTLEAIGGPLELDFNDGTGDLIVDDTQDATGDNVTISGTAITGMSAGPINYVNANPLDVTVRAGSGGDSIALDETINANSMFVDGQGGADTIDGADAPLPLTLEGGDGDDRLTGSDQADLIDGQNGEDSIFGLGGADILQGNSGNDNLWGGNGADTINGGLGDDTVEGGSANDNIFGNEGSDDLSGGEGNDAIEGGADADTLNGDSGNDTLTGNEGADLIQGGADNDVAIWGLGDEVDTVVGGTGTDTLEVTFSDLSDNVGLQAVDNQPVITIDGVGGAELAPSLTEDVERLSLQTGLSDDTIVIGDLSTTSLTGVRVVASGGNDLIDAREATPGVANDFSGGDGKDTIWGGSGDDEINGGLGADLIIGGKGRDDLNGDGGDDLFIWNNGDGSDLANGGVGFDTQEVNASEEGDEFTLSGGQVLDTVSNARLSRTNLGTFTIDLGFGTEKLDMNLGGGDDSVVITNLTATGVTNIDIDMAKGDDFLDASKMTATANMRVLGGLGHDDLSTGPGDDFIRGSKGKDRLRGGAGDDSLMADAGNDTLVGGGGRDTLKGSSGDDLLKGKGGADFIQAGTGKDRIWGDGGSDILIGSLGNDLINAGDGKDIVIGGDGNDTLNGGDGRDVIIGGFGKDRIDGGGDQDIISGGSTTLNQQDLRRVRAEWTANRNYELRRKNIVYASGTSDRKNGASFINPGETVFDEADSGGLKSDKNQITGGLGRDLFFVSLGSDTLTDTLPLESRINLFDIDE